MSDSQDQPPKPPKPIKKTSAVPLKKETVRVTLKATGGVEESAEAGTKDAPAPPAPPAPPKAPTAPKPPAAAGGAPPPPAPTIPLKTGGGGGAAPKPAAPAPTVRLNTPGGAGAPKTAALQTQPLGGGAKPSSQPLPKATVKLGGATQALGAPTGAAKPGATPSFGAAVDDDEDEGDDKIPGILSLVAFLGSLAVLVLEILTVSLWDGWGQLF